MKNLAQSCIPRQTVLDGTADFVVNLADLPRLTEAQAREFLESNVLTSGMEMLLVQAFSRMAGIGSVSGLFKLSESMGGGKTQAMIVAGILARFPHLVELIEFHNPLPRVSPDVVAAFSGRATDKKVWVALGDALSVRFPGDRAPSEEEWRDALKGRPVLILLDELAFYLVHAASQGSKEVGTRAATLAGIALTNLFGAVRDYKECRQAVIVIADLQKDWEQGAEELAWILKSNDLLGSAIASVDNEMSKGAQSIAPVDNTKDELYAILRRRLFQNITVLPGDLPRPEAIRFPDIPPTERNLWKYSPLPRLPCPETARRRRGHGPCRQTPARQHRLLDHPRRTTGRHSGLPPGNHRNQPQLATIPQPPRRLVHRGGELEGVAILGINNPKGGLA